MSAAASDHQPAFAESHTSVDVAGGHRLALRMVQPATPALATVLCLHGLFSDGRFFLNGAQGGPGRYFLEQGFRIAIGELRGHGRSQWPATPRRHDWTFDDYVQHDIPAIIEAAAQQAPQPLFVLAHSLAGYATLAALGCNPALQARLRGVCALSAAVNDYSEQGVRKRCVFLAAVMLSRLLGRFPAQVLRLGVADEPPRLMKQFADWAPQGLFANWTGEVDYWRCLSAVTLPVWAGVGAADRFHASVAGGRKLIQRLGSSDKTFVELGRSAGLSRDLGHADVLRSAVARHEVLPQLATWMRQHAPAAVNEAVDA